MMILLWLILSKISVEFGWIKFENDKNDGGIIYGHLKDVGDFISVWILNEDYWLG